MKTKNKEVLKFNCFVIVMIVFLNVNTAFAHDGEKHEQNSDHSNEHEEKVNTSNVTAQEVVKSILEEETNLTKTISEKRLSDVHGIAFKIRDLAKILPSKVSDEKRSRVEGTVGNISLLAEELDKSGDAGNQEKTENNAKKLNGILKILLAQIN